MSSSNSVLRRYTPPTCTLEITAVGSPLSRWIGRPAINQLQFQLSLDDPRLPEEKRLTLKGDKTQLEALRETVETYVQELVGQYPDNSPALLPSPVTDTAEQLETEAPAANLVLDTTDDRRSVAPATSPDAATPAALPPTALTALPGNIYLQPDGMLAHNLYLGSLATPESESVVRLSTLQLFDLATAFEQYAEELVVLPNLKRGRNKGFATGLKNTPIWAKTAAGLVLAAGATAAGVQLLGRNTSFQTANAPPESLAPTPTEQSPIAGIPSPSPTLVVPTPPLSSSQILPSPTLGAGVSPSPGASPPVGAGVLPNVLPGVTPTPVPSPSLSGNLPQNRAVGVPVPPSPNPPAAGSAPSGSYKVPGLQFDARRPRNIATPTPTQPPVVRNDASDRLRPSTLPRATIAPEPVAPATAPPQPRRDRVAVRTTPTPNPTFFPSPDVTPKVTAPSARVPAANPAPTVQAPAAIPTPRLEIPKAIATPTLPVPPAIATPAIPVSPAIPRATIGSPPAIPTPAANPSASAIPTPAANPSASAIPTPMAAAPAVIPLPTPRATNPNPPVAASGSTPSPQPEANRNPATDSNNTSAVFDPIPQVAEVRRYFQQRWQPPSTLTQNIEYSLSLNPDGSIRTVTPRGQTAEIYLDRTEMPLVGEPFVSPLDGGRNTTIILVLSKDGKVDAFLERSN